LGIHGNKRSEAISLACGIHYQEIASLRSQRRLNKRLP
jgi:hypothetical protein